MIHVGEEYQAEVDDYCKGTWRYMHACHMFSTCILVVMGNNRVTTHLSVWSSIRITVTVIVVLRSYFKFHCENEK